MSDRNGKLPDVGYKPYKATGEYVETWDGDARLGEVTVRLDAQDDEIDLEWLIAQAVEKAFARLDAAGPGKDLDSIVTANPMKNWAEACIAREFCEFVAEEKGDECEKQPL